MVPVLRHRDQCIWHQPRANSVFSHPSTVQIVVSGIRFDLWRSGVRRTSAPPRFIAPQTSYGHRSMSYYGRRWLSGSAASASFALHSSIHACTCSGVIRLSTRGDCGDEAGNSRLTMRPFRFRRTTGTAHHGECSAAESPAPESGAAPACRGLARRSPARAGRGAPRLRRTDR